MPNKETTEIQDFLVSLGNELGFSASKEQVLSRYDGYNPCYDVIWFVDLKEYLGSSFDVFKGFYQKRLVERCRNK